MCKKYFLFNRETRRMLLDKIKRLYKHVNTVICLTILSITLLTGLKNICIQNTYDNINMFPNDSVCAFNTNEYYTTKINHDGITAQVELDIKNAKEFAEQIKSSSLEYKQKGNYYVEHAICNPENKSDDCTFESSSNSIRIDYEAILGLSNESIKVSIDGTKVSVNFNEDAIKMLSIDVNESELNDEYEYQTAIRCNAKEFDGIPSSVKHKIINDLMLDNQIKLDYIENITEYFTSLAKEKGIDNFSINGKDIFTGYKYQRYGIIKYNHPNKNLNSVKYIVVHSTGDKNNNNAKYYFDYWNKCKHERCVSAHLVVDSENVVECLPTTMKAYHTGLDNHSGINNNNSIGIEMCETDNIKDQAKIIENTMHLVNELKKKYPFAKVVMHRQAKDTECPEILTNEMFDIFFKKDSVFIY